MSNWQQESNLCTERCSNVWDSGAEPGSEEGELWRSLRCCFGKTQAVCVLQLLARAVKPVTHCRPAAEPTPLPTMPSLSPPAQNYCCLHHLAFGSPSNRFIPGGKLHIYPCQEGQAEKNPHLPLEGMYVVVVQLARKWHILGEVSSGEPGGAHQQLKLCCLLVAIPLDSSKQRRKVLPSISCQEDALLTLESLAVS